MRQTLCQYLECPVCRSGLKLSAGESDGDEILDGDFTCTGCGRITPIVGGVPRFIPKDLSHDVQHTARNFGASWKIWREIDDVRYRRQLLQWLPSLVPQDVEGKTVLDAGCGKGRHLRTMAQLGAKAVIGVDLSDAVDVAFANTCNFPNVHIVQADLRALPFRRGFDLAYSVGVLHHTPDPAASFRAVVDLVRPGGNAGCWVYGRENNGWIISLVNPVRLCLTRHLPSWMVLAISSIGSVVLFGLIYGLYVPAKLLGLRLFYRDYLLNLKRLGFAETRHIVYDHLIAPTAFYLRREEVQSWFDDKRFADATVSWVNCNSWSGLGRLTA